MRIYDQQQRAADDNPTIGLILCSQKSEAVVKYSVLTDSEQLFAAKYLPYLPSEEEQSANWSWIGLKWKRNCWAEKEFSSESTVLKIRNFRTVLRLYKINGLRVR